MNNEMWVFLGVLVTALGGFAGIFATNRANRKNAELDAIPLLTAQLSAALKETRDANSQINELERKISSLMAENEHLKEQLKEQKNGGS
jgi:predicted  nucleic acid-binding Zn-ribbon protein